MARERATRKAATSGEAAPARRASEYLIRRRGLVMEGTSREFSAWIECGAISASSPRKALAAYGEQHAEELAALDGPVELEAISARFRLALTPSVERQLSIKWGSS